EGRALAYHDTIGTFTRAKTPASHTKVGDWKLLRNQPTRPPDELAGLFHSAKLNLRRHQLHGVVLSVHRRKQDDHCTPLIDDFAHARLDQFVPGRRNPSTLTVEHGHWSPPLAIEQFIDCGPVLSCRIGLPAIGRQRSL